MTASLNADDEPSMIQLNRFDLIKERGLTSR